ncbi:Transposable element P transposase [Frankliniella fusca]|uniref:Transposable element P transposase n=1 Tax=Frankliniella fusca TaxID=407009 RepID=A0AAE1L4P9_9NEOP|nr:Transposable element P transposase [Frankliniella fusca]
MVKGITSDVKYVVAAFPLKDLNCDMLYVKSWQVILSLEKAGIKIIVFVYDGAPNNRAFIKMHRPITRTESGVVFDTVNFCSPERRPLFFMSDVCHLMKTIRNCLYNSGVGDKKTRCMEINGEKLMWKDIIKLYLTYKDNNFRMAYKLNAQNVYPNKFSCMSVKYAAQVLIKTVALDIENQKWPGTKELVRFIRYVNKIFDCLNGAFSTQDKRTRNENLAPYKDIDDKRFDWLCVPNLKRSEPKCPSSEKPFLQYLSDWKKEAEKSKKSSKEIEKMQLATQTVTGRFAQSVSPKTCLSNDISPETFYPMHFTH